MPADKFLEYTWGKPRDIVRFFKIAKDQFGNRASLDKSAFDSVLKGYANLAWLEMKSALAAFMPKESLPLLETCLRSIAKITLDGSAKNKKNDVINAISPTFKDMEKRGVLYDVDEFFSLLYIVGIFYMTYFDAKGQRIVHQFHRGNRQPADDGYVHLHYAVAKAFS